jgi:hypothetical protein
LKIIGECTSRRARVSAHTIFKLAVVVIQLSAAFEGLMAPRAKRMGGFIEAAMLQNDSQDTEDMLDEDRSHREVVS